MPLTESEKQVLEIIARYTFLANAKDIGYLDEDKYKELMSKFGYKNHELIQYYLERLNEHLGETRDFLDSLEETKTEK